MIKNYSLALIAAAVSADPWLYEETTYTATVREGYSDAVSTQAVTKTANLSIEETSSGVFDMTLTKRFDVSVESDNYSSSYRHHLVIVDEGAGG